MNTHEVPLAGLLRRAGISPAQLAADVNQWLDSRGLGARRIHPTGPYQWLRNGYKPYAPVPAAVAEVLSARLGICVSPADIWPGRAPPVTAVGAVSGLDGYQVPGDAVAALALLASGAHAEVTPSAGPDLTAAVRIAFQAAQARDGSQGRDGVLAPYVAMMASHVAGMRRLDDLHGGGALSLPYITGQLRAGLDLARSVGAGRDTGHELLEVLADLAQLSGWCNFDAGRSGMAQRYLLLSQYMARAAADNGRAANAAGMLSYICAFAGEGTEAVHIAAAAEAASPAHPAVRARLRGRMATACAAAGDTAGFRSAASSALDLLGTAGNAPGYLYYLTPDQLLSEQGQALVVLAGRAETGRKKLLREAVSILAPISGTGARPDYPRSALLHGAFLARGYLLAGEVDAAVGAIRAALTRLADVRSIRATRYLRELRPALARRKRAQVVADFMPEFDDALSRHVH